MRWRRRYPVDGREYALKLAPFILLAGVTALAGCQQQPANDGQQPQPQPNMAQQQPDPAAQERERARQEMGELRYVVDKSDRKVRVYRGQQEIEAHDVTIGTSEYETPTGEWTIQQVDINPEWVPPDSDWAKDEERQPPGDPDNPMGRARLIFSSPYSIHGTDETDTLGTKASHGSIRVANEIVLRLAEMTLKAGGAWEGDGWFRRMTESRNQMHQIRLDNPVRIEVQE
jgi:lipoprotein-anchoring transpeptidase ErfK/SrfK